MFDDDPQFQALKRIREDECYDGPLDQDRTPNPATPQGLAADALRRTGAGT